MATSLFPKGHGAGNNRILKFDKNGKFIKEWGKLGTRPGEFDQSHSLAFDSKGRVYIADRNNDRIQVFDQEGNYLSEMQVQPAERPLHRQKTVRFMPLITNRKLSREIMTDGSAGFAPEVSKTVK